MQWNGQYTGSRGKHSQPYRRSGIQNRDAHGVIARALEEAKSQLHREEMAGSSDGPYSALHRGMGHFRLLDMDGMA